jgi:hypothetical protein
MRRPHFFILGAPKCGTTSLAAWLAAHPRIFIPVKEPHYFNTDEARVFTSLAAYERLFRRAGERHVAIGDASVWYLYSTAAVANIEAYNPASRYIVLLRDPLAMAPSLHEQMVFAGVEPIADFARAWAMQEERRAGRALPGNMAQPRRLIYGDACKLGAQLARLYERVARERVLALLLEDVQADPRRVYLRVLDFLGVGDDGRSDFPVHNTAKARIVPGLAKANLAAYRLKRALGIERSFGILDRLDELTSVSRPRPKLAPALARELARYFAADVQHLAALLDRDLSHWLQAD